MVRQVSQMDQCPLRMELAIFETLHRKLRWMRRRADDVFLQQPPKKVQKETTTVSLGPQVADGELVFGVAHIFASFNDTFVHVTDLSGKETIVRVTGSLFHLPALSTHIEESSSLLGVM